ncbi:thioredoxin family protein [Leuconostoc palmae]|uniref:thioredoxin family protein n=1 Tax=Leuconostoc palmae TaxID=501487 RepID=UPI001C7DCFC1|nr:thioredoxin family protein [Leuconostoc palmae]
MYEPTKNSDAVLENYIHESGRHVMFLSADWCGDCRVIKPFVQNIKDHVSQTATWFDADRDDNIAVAKKYNMRGIPSFVLFEDGKEISRIGHGERLTPQQVLEWYDTTLN